MSPNAVDSSSHAAARDASASTPGRFDYDRIDGVRGNPHVTGAFLREVEAMGGRLGTRPEYLLAVMSFETGGSFNPAERNGAGSGATGLIQFMPATAPELGTTTEALTRMSALDQLQYVERYFARRSDPADLGTLEGVYTTVLYGSPRPDPGATLFAQGSAAYRMNAPLDLNGDGRITAGEATQFVRERVEGEFGASAGPAPRPSPAPDSRQAPAGGHYRIQPGDTLGALAARFGTSVAALARANGIANPDLIHAGNHLEVPGAAPAYTVQPGDTLSGLAARFSTSVGALMAANPQVRDSDLIHVGERLRLPGASQSPAPAPASAPTAPVPAPAAPFIGPVISHAPYTVYSTGEGSPVQLRDAGQMQPHHDYQSASRDGQRLEVRDVVLHRPGQSQTSQAVPAPIAGEVIHAGPNGSAGNAVGLRDADGRVAWVFHLSSVDVRVGQIVGYGQALGNQGSTGNSTGPHVHIEAAPALIRRWVNDLLDGRFDGRPG